MADNRQLGRQDPEEEEEEADCATGLNMYIYMSVTLSEQKSVYYVPFSDEMM